MPAIPAIYDPNSQAINEIADEERKARNQEIDLHWRYYNGDHKQPLTVDGHDYNIILNLFDTAIDKFVEFIGTPDISLEGGRDNVILEDGTVATQKTPEQELLEALAKQSEIEELLADTLTSGAVTGHNYWRIVLDEDEYGIATPSSNNLPYLMLLDSRYVSVFWDQMTRKRLYYRLEWEIGEVGYRQDIVPASLLPEKNGFSLTIDSDGWAILEFIRPKGKTRFEFDRGAAWNAPFPPIIDWKTRRKAHSYYGDHDMKGITVNDAINFNATNNSKIIKHHGHPKTVIFGAEAESLQEVAPDELWTIPNEEARMQSIEMQSDLRASMEFMTMLRNFFFTKMRVLDTSTVKDRIGNLTNFGVRMLFNDMIKNVEDRRSRTSEKAINVAFKRMLWMMGIEVDGVITKWDDPLPMDRAELVDTVDKESKLGITSKQTLSDDLGRDFKKEQAQMREEKNIDVDDRVSTITRLAQFGVNGGQSNINTTNRG